MDVTPDSDGDAGADTAAMDEETVDAPDGSAVALESTSTGGCAAGAGGASAGLLLLLLFLGMPLVYREIRGTVR